ncbi:Tpr-like protein [Theileria parva strain Muguga]|uniref:Uncharacterized protein n=1 Tax=Theileria parva TaxID=5875 RepID=Q4N1S4_THEPA|nr:Tpr-like protein [Theileria parva strain Muguga]EAN32008.1 Tpr-like protein [Theileria parva strain Muguga]|eukprot:XP_764291.1 hypothetical protein [Theileria parva strain Muguga]
MEMCKRSCRTSIIEALSKFCMLIKKIVVNEKFYAAFNAFSAHMFIQIASVTSKHISVAFKIPAENTGIYFAKLLSARGLISLAASILSYIINMTSKGQNVLLSTIFCVSIFLFRFIFMVFLHTSENLPLTIYLCYILEGIAVGLFQMPFYSLTAEYVSILSVSFKLSRITLFILQIFLDLANFENPLVMVKIQYWFAFVITCISTGLWFAFCFNKPDRKKKREQKTVEEFAELGDESFVLKVGEDGDEETPNFRDDETPNTRNEELEILEPTFFGLFLEQISPYFMCLVGIMMKTTIHPGILPYSLLDREKCHLINMVLTPMALIATTTIHILKENVKSMDRRWDWKWNLMWLNGIPPFTIVIIIFVALHSKGCISSGIINAKWSVFAIGIIFFLFNCTLESAGYVGIVSNVKQNGKITSKGRKIVSTGQISSLIAGFIFYKFSIGYSVTRKIMQSDIPLAISTEKMSRFGAFCFWLGRTITEGCKDFVNDFRLNIKNYI